MVRVGFPSTFMGLSDTQFRANPVVIPLDESADPRSIPPPFGGREARARHQRLLSKNRGLAACFFLPLKGGGSRWGSRAVAQCRSSCHCAPCLSFSEYRY